MSALQSFGHLQELALTSRPHLAIVLGSGLGTVTGGMQVLSSVPFSQIPGLTSPSVQGHEGRLTLCEWREKNVLVFEGRLHFYEGHSWDVVTLPIQIAFALGARALLATNAAGGIHPCLNPGSFMTVREHLDWTRPFSSRVGSGSDRHLPHSERARTFNAASPYSCRLINIIQRAAANLKLDLQTGIYAAVTGPNYETPAEIRALRHCNADAVGMSTVREVDMAHRLGMECAAISCITNRAAGLDQRTFISHQDVLQTAMANSGKLATLLESLIEAII